MNKFIPWINTANVNCMTYDQFASDNQRQVGFITGTPASSIRVNSALRQANLVVAALMNVLLPDSQLDLRSSLAEVITGLRSSMTDVLYSVEGNTSLMMKNCTSNFQRCVLLGQGLISSKDNQVVLGKYNQTNSAANFIFGWGTNISRKNIFSIFDNSFVLYVSSFQCNGIKTTGNIETKDVVCDSVNAAQLVKGSNFLSDGTAKSAASLKPTSVPITQQIDGNSFKVFVPGLSDGDLFSFVDSTDERQQSCSSPIVCMGSCECAFVFEGKTYSAQIGGIESTTTIHIVSSGMSAQEIQNALSLTNVRIYGNGGRW